MSATGIVVTIVVVAAVVAIAVLVWQLMRRRRLRQRFGPEYDRTVATQPNRGAAEHELRAREQRHAALELKELTADEQQRYTRLWMNVQSQFVDEPKQAVTDADALITDVMRDRGYPIGGDFGDRLKTLSVEHARTLDHYRAAHEISEANARGEASTEQLRQALVHYRTLAADLLGPAPSNPGRHAGNTPIDERKSQ
jgi:hypothetical protein